MAAIPEACAILTSFRHCQRQAAAFRKCTELRGGSGGDVAQKCAFEHDSFVVCADESLEQKSGLSPKTGANILILSRLIDATLGAQRCAERASRLPDYAASMRSRSIYLWN